MYATGFRARRHLPRIMMQSGHSGAASKTLTVAWSQISTAWRGALAATLLLLAFILVFYRDTAIAMVSIWYRSGTFTHAFVVPPIVVWLIWRRRAELAVLVPKPAWSMLLPMALAAIVWLLGDLVAVNALTQLAFTAMLVLTVPALLGFQVARTILFPLGFLFFAVPIGEFLLPQLMEWTAHFTIVALRMSGIPVYQQGLQFVIPSGSWSVVEACGGVRYLIASLTVGTLFAYLNYHSAKRRVLFVIVSILVPVVANWMRAYMIVMLGHLSGNTIAVGVDHLIYGWVFFGVVIMLMFFIGARWSEPELHVAPVYSPRMPDLGNSQMVGLLLVTAAIAAIVTLPLIGRSTIQGVHSTASPVLRMPTALLGGWQSRDGGAPEFKPGFQNPSAQTNTVYIKAGQMVGVYLGYYQDQDYDSKLVSSDNVLVASNDARWSRVHGGSQRVVFGEQRANVRTSELGGLPLSAPDRGGPLIVWQIYWIDGKLTSSDYLAKAYSAIDRLLGYGDHSAVIVLYTNSPPGSADGTLQDFLSANYAFVDASLRQAKVVK